MLNRRLLLVAAIALACGDPVSPLRDGDVVIVSDHTSGWSDPVTIVDAAIVDDSLRVTAQFGGGCQPHEFALLVSNAVLKSLPPQVMMRVAHDGNGDACDAWLTRTLSFDLAVLRTHFAPPPGSGGGPTTIVFRLDGSTAELRYTF